MISQNKRLVGIVITVALILCVPLVAMQFSEGVQWGPFDFLVAGTLLLGTGLLGDLVMRKVKTRGSRIALCILLLIVLLLIWAELAVGIFGTPFAGS